MTSTMIATSSYDASRAVTAIPLTTDHEIGPTLRRLRHDAGLSLRQLSIRASLSPSGILKREQRTAGYVGILIEHVRPLGYSVALIPRQHARSTGTGWPS